MIKCKCGGAPTVSGTFGSPGIWFATCKDCNKMGPPGDTKQEAAINWNAKMEKEK